MLMKSFFPTRAIALMTVATMLVAHTAQAGLVGHWKLDEDPAADGTLIVDSSAPAYNGPLTTNDGAANKSVASSVAALGTAIEFDFDTDMDGAVTGGDYANLTSPALNAVSPGLTDPRTLSLWFRTDVLPTAEATLFHQSSGVGSAGRSFRFTVEEDPNIAGRLAIRQRHGGGSRTYSPSLPADPAVFGVGDWVHLAAVVPNGAATTEDVQVYINGELAALSTQTGGSVRALSFDPADASAFGAQTRLGGSINGFGGDDRFFLDGALDDVQLYDFATDAAGVSFLFNNPGQMLIPEPSSLVLLLGSLVAVSMRTRRVR